MESADLIPLIEQLDDNVDDLEEALAPILESTVIESSKKLPVLDKAKFHVLITYALESLIFCTVNYLTISTMSELTDCFHSVLTPTRCKSYRASGFQRTNQGETILRQDKVAGDGSRAKDYGS